MDKHKYNDNDSFYRQKFDDYDVELPADDWNVFSRKLAEAQPKRRRFAFYYIAAAASVIGVIFIGSFLLNKQDNPAETILARQDISQPKQPQKKSLASNVSGKAVASLTPQNRVGASAVTAQTSGKVSVTQSARPTSNEHVENGITETVAATSPAGSASTVSTSVPQKEIVQNGVVTEAFDTAGYITHPVPLYAELPALPTDRGGDAEQKKQKK